MTDQTILCKQCEMEFLPRTSWQKFCSLRCSVQNRMRRLKASRQRNLCVVCGLVKVSRKACPNCRPAYNALLARQYQQRNSQVCATRVKEWRQSPAGQKWRAENKAKLNKQAHNWQMNHREQHGAAVRKCYARNRNYYLQKHKEWQKANPDLYREQRRRKRARLRNAPGSYDLRQWRELVEFYGGRCAYCGRTGALQPDHKVPLSRGGTNYIENILPVCGSCNAKKGAKTIGEFLGTI